METGEKEITHPNLQVFPLQAHMSFTRYALQYNYSEIQILLLKIIIHNPIRVSILLKQIQAIGINSNTGQYSSNCKHRDYKYRQSPTTHLRTTTHQTSNHRHYNNCNHWLRRSMKLTTHKRTPNMAFNRNHSLSPSLQIRIKHLDLQLKEITPFAH